MGRFGLVLLLAAQTPLCGLVNPPASSPSGAGPHVTYVGGPPSSSVIPHPKVVVVDWGNHLPPADQGLGRFYSTLTQGPYLSWLKEYTPAGSPPLGDGTFAGSYTIYPSQTQGTITDGEIRQGLSSAVASGALPRPDKNTVYMTYFPPGLKIYAGDVKHGGFGTSCQDFCGYHGNITTGPGAPIRYAVLPDLSAPACQSYCGQGPFPQLTAVSSHELVEIITDANGQGWGDPTRREEIGDFCKLQDARLDGYEVQKIYDLQTHRCILDRLTPLSSSPSAGTLGSGSRAIGYNRSRSTASVVRAAPPQPGIGQTR